MALEVAPLKPLLETAIVYPDPTWSRVNPAKVATPLFAVTESVPPSVAPSGLFASATVTTPLNEDARSPALSSAWTIKPKEAPAMMLAGGCWVITSSWAGTGITAMALDVAPLSPLLETASVDPDPTWSRVNPAKVATPLLAVTESVPPRFAPSGLFASATATAALSSVSTLP